MARQHDPRVREPVHTPAVVAKTGATRHLRDLELPVLLRELRRHVVQYVQDAPLVQPLGVFPRIIPPAVHERALQLKRPLERLPLQITRHHFRHSPEGAEVAETLAQDIPLKWVERTLFRNVRVDVLDERGIVA